MKHIKSYINTDIRLFESFENKFVGIHCSPKSLNHDDFYGKILNEYYMMFKQILELVQYDYKQAKELLTKIESFADGISLADDSIDLVFEIEEFFADNNL